MSTVLVPLNRGKFALIDAKDAELVLAHRWTMRGGRRGVWYVATRIGRRKITLHRFVLGDPPGTHIDHENRDGLDCRRANLRVCTRSQNRQNSTMPSTNASGFKGVSFHKLRGKWQAQIGKDRRKTHLGYFASPVDAALAYDAAAREAFGVFGRFNFPLPGEQGARQSVSP